MLDDADTAVRSVGCKKPSVIHPLQYLLNSQFFVIQKFTERSENVFSRSTATVDRACSRHHT